MKQRWLGWLRAVGVGAICTGVLVGAAEGQVPADVRDYELPRWIRGDVEAVSREAATQTFVGETYIEAEVVMDGAVVVVEGPLLLDGIVEGDVVVINGDLEVGDSAVIQGDAIVVGGALFGRGSQISGEVTVYRKSAPRARSRDSAADRRADRRRADRERPRWDDRNDRRRRNRWASRGDADFTVRVGPTYNRTEGLPIGIGPRFHSGGFAPFDLEALAIWRTATSFDNDIDDVDTDELGYSVRAEQRFGYDVQPFFGGRVYRIVDPIERWGLSDSETSLATLLLHDDYRDYFDREGWSAHIGLRVPDAGMRLTVDYRDEEFGFRPVADPWTVFGDDEIWRPQPLVAEGNLRSVGGEVRFELPDHYGTQGAGLSLRVSGRWGLDGVLRVPDHVESGVDVTPLAYDPEQLRYGTLDLIQRTSLGWNNQLDLRLIAGGSLNDRPLPPQFQHAIGGVGSRPGHNLFAGDCGARTVGATLARPYRGSATQTAVSNYGCDRFALFQAEYRGGVDFNFDWDGDRGRDRDPDNWGNWEDWSRGARSFDTSFQWSVFFDAGRGWIQDPNGADDTRFDTETLMDAGVGVWLGGLGLLAAVPLDTDDHSWNFFIRFERRF